MKWRKSVRINLANLRLKVNEDHLRGICTSLELYPQSLFIYLFIYHLGWSHSLGKILLLSKHGTVFDLIKSCCFLAGTGFLFSLCSLGKETLQFFSTPSTRGCRRGWDALSCLLCLLPRGRCGAATRFAGIIWGVHQTGAALELPQRLQKYPQATWVWKMQLFHSNWRRRSPDGSGHDPERLQDIYQKIFGILVLGLTIIPLMSFHWRQIIPYNF